MLAKTIRILYVEDDSAHADVITRMLEKISCADFVIEHRGDLKSSIDYLTSVNCNVDIVLLDLMLPNSRGVDTFLEVYKKCKKVPVVIISGHEDIAIECISLGAQDYLIKPEIPPKLLARSIEYSIERKKLQDRYRELVEVTRAAIYEIDFRKNRFVYVNDQVCKLTGYSREEFLSMNATDFLTDKSAQEFAERLEKLKYGEFIPHTYEYELKLKGGGTKWTLITAKYKEDVHGNVIGANVVAIDITEQKLAEQALKRKEEQIFDELEHKIQMWKDEIIEDTQLSKQKLQLISNDIKSMQDNGAI